MILLRISFKNHILEGFAHWTAPPLCLDSLRVFNRGSRALTFTPPWGFLLPFAGFAQATSSKNQTFGSRDWIWLLQEFILRFRLCKSCTWAWFQRSKIVILSRTPYKNEITNELQECSWRTPTMCLSDQEPGGDTVFHVSMTVPDAIYKFCVRLCNWVSGFNLSTARVLFAFSTL